MVVTVAFRFILGFGTALTLNTKFRGCGLARALIIIPWAVPEVVACLVWILMYDKDYGIINSMLTGMGVLSGNVGWLLDKNVALPAAMADVYKRQEIRLVLPFRIGQRLCIAG